MSNLPCTYNLLSHWESPDYDGLDGKTSPNPDTPNKDPKNNEKS